tara:strand:+ start:475 stop:675 length:201 start_codon:yes stop_codon:yes gene_type:complete
MSQIITFPPGTFPEPEQQAPSAETLLALLDLLSTQQTAAQEQPKRRIGFVLPEPKENKDENENRNA